jgi:prevent-host-death family protein
MIATGISELKAKLSSYIEKVRSGEQVVITDHNEEVAMIISISKERRAITALVKRNKVQWSGNKPRGMEGIVLKGKPLSETVLEERK